MLDMASIPENYRRLEGSERHPAPGARFIRRVDPGETLSVTIGVRRRPDAAPLPDQDHWASKRVADREYVAREEFASRHGAAPEDLDRVASFARSKGLTVIDSNAARRTVTVSGTATQMEQAFGVELGHYQSESESYRGREGHIYVPTEIADIVQGVWGLDNRQVSKPRTTITGTSSLTPVQVAQLYGFPSPGKATGQTIGILEFGGGYAVSDIQAFLTGLGLTTPALTDVSIGGATNSVAGSASNVSASDIEVVLDIDVAAAVAQEASIAVYFAQNTEQGWIDCVGACVHPSSGQPTPSVLSISWAGPENGPQATWTSSGIQSLSATFQEAASLGVTVLAAAGDWGSWGSSKAAGDGNAYVDYPASDPWVTGTGGTTISNVSSSTFTENTWNDGAGGTTGGGVSAIFPQPAWQANANVPVSANASGGKGRGVPDIAGNASGLSGYVLTLYGQQMTNATGGTSAVAPLYAALVAIVNSNIGTPVGYLNPLLYSLAGSRVFRDVADGANNQWSGVSPASPGYTSAAGWDACTGWGSVNGVALLNALNPDPIANAIWLLAVLATPNPLPNPALPPTAWVGSTAPSSGATPTQPLYGVIQSFLGAIFTASTDVQAASNDIKSALADVAKVLGAIATNIPTTGTVLTDFNNAMTALQNSISLAQSLAPSSATAVLTSASGLFQRLQAQLTAIANTGTAGTINQVIAELAQLSQLITAIADLFPPS